MTPLATNPNTPPRRGGGAASTPDTTPSSHPGTTRRGRRVYRRRDALVASGPAAVVLLSGGVDSSTLLHHVHASRRYKTIYALSFNYGQKHSRELAMASWQARAAGVKEHRVLDLSFFGELVKGGSALTDAAIQVPDLAAIRGRARRQPPTYVPNRNMMLLSLAAAYAEAHGCRDVFYGAQAQDEYGYWDCTPEFVRRLNRVLALNRGTPVRVHAPFAAKSKAAVVALGLRLGVDYAHTWTCYRGARRPCGACPSCVERARAFQRAGVPDPITH